MVHISGRALSEPGSVHVRMFKDLISLQSRVGHGSIFADPIQSNPPTDGSNPIQSKIAGIKANS